MWITWGNGGVARSSQTSVTPPTPRTWDRLALRGPWGSFLGWGEYELLPLWPLWKVWTCSTIWDLTHRDQLPVDVRVFLPQAVHLL